MKKVLAVLFLFLFVEGSLSARPVSGDSGSFTPPVVMKCCYHDRERGYWESSCFNDARGDWMCGVWIGGNGMKIPCDAPCEPCTHQEIGNCDVNCNALCPPGYHSSSCQNLNSFCYRGRTLVSAACCIPNNTRGGFFIRNQAPGVWFEVGSWDRHDVWVRRQADESGTLNVDFLPVGSVVYVWRIPDGAVAKVKVQPGRQEVFLK